MGSRGAVALWLYPWWTLPNRRPMQIASNVHLISVCISACFLLRNSDDMLRFARSLIFVPPVEWVIPKLSKEPGLGLCLLKFKIQKLKLIQSTV